MLDWYSSAHKYSEHATLLKHRKFRGLIVTLVRVCGVGRLAKGSKKCQRDSPGKNLDVSLRYREKLHTSDFCRRLRGDFIEVYKIMRGLDKFPPRAS